MAVARHFTELIVWQLADQLRIEVFQLTKRGRFHADWKLRSQLDDAADSACRNIAEGFAGTDPEFAKFLRIARRSLNEVQGQFSQRSTERIRIRRRPQARALAAAPYLSRAVVTAQALGPP